MPFLRKQKPKQEMGAAGETALHDLARLIGVRVHEDALEGALADVLLGHRAACTLAVSRLGDHVDRLAYARRTRLPLVVWATSAAGDTQAGDTEAGDTASGDMEAAYRLGDAGTIVLVSPDAERAPLLALAAHIVAERCLLPVACVLQLDGRAESVRLPEAVVGELLPDVIPSMDAHQSHLFGDRRSAVPARVSLSIPGGTGTRLEGRERLAERAGYARMGRDQIHRVIADALASVGAASGTDLSPRLVTSPRRPKARIVVPALLGDLPDNVQVERIVQLWPPTPAEAFDGPTAAVAPASPDAIRSWTRAASLDASVVACGWGQNAPTESDWTELGRRLLDGSLVDDSVMGLVSAPYRPLPPDTERLHQLVRRDAPTLDDGLLERTGDGADHSAPDAPGTDTDAPTAAFWRSVGYLYQAKRDHELLPDPYAAFSALPARTAELLTGREYPAAVPLLVAERCTGCGVCWSTCPDAALIPTAFDADTLVADAIVQAEKREPLAMLGRFGSALAGEVRRLIRKDDLFQYGTSDALLNEALERLVIRAKASEEDAGRMRADLVRLLSVVPKIRLARPDALPAGGLLSVIADPNRCTDCGLCARACPEEALESVSLPDPEPAKAQALYARRLGLSDGARAALADMPGGLMLDPEPADVLVSGSFAPGLALSLRLALGSVHTVASEGLKRLRERADTAVAALETAISQEVSSAATISNFEGFTRRLAHLDGSPSAETLAELAAAGGAAPLETTRLAALAEARDRLISAFPGNTPIVALFDASVPLPSHPSNPFSIPWVAEATPDMAGAVWDRLSEDAEGRAAALHRAEHESRDTYDPSEPVPAPPAGEVPAVLFITTELTEGVLRILSGARPVRVLLLTSNPEASARATLGALITTGAAGVQSTPAFLEHAARGIRRVLASEGPALIHLQVPDGASEDLLSISEAAVTSRAFPLFDVHEDGRLDVSGNPSAASRWCEPIVTPGDWFALADRQAFFPLRRHAAPDGHRPHADVLDGEDGVPTIHLDGEHVAVVPNHLHDSSRKLIALWDRMRALAAGGIAPSVVASSPDTKPTAATKPATPTVPADALATLTDRLLTLSGFGPGGEGGARSLRDLVPEDDG